MAESQRNLDHLYVQGRVKTEDFHRTRGGSSRPLREVDRHSHGNMLKHSAEHVFTEFDRQREEFISEEMRATGTIIVLEGEGSTYPLKVDSLTAYTGGKTRKEKWLLLALRAARGEKPETAVVWVSDQYRSKFLQIFEDYLNENKDTAAGRPRNQELVANISRIREAVLDDLWTSEKYPEESGSHWWQLWLDGNSPHLGDWKLFARKHNLDALPEEIRFGDNLIVWVKASWEELKILPFTSVPVTEIRVPQLIKREDEEYRNEQTECVLAFTERLDHMPGELPTVCLLDTGVLRTHVLLSGSLAASDLHSIFGGSGTDVHSQGHGTSMAGLALFGNLDPLLLGQNQVLLSHRLESVRIHPGPGEQSPHPRDYGTATVKAVALPEVTRPDRRRAFSLTITAPPDKPGEPTLWSATVDALAVGTDIVRNNNELQLLTHPEHSSSRLLIVAAGNVWQYDNDYHTNCINSPIQDPAQAWNALTVGAYTELTTAPTDQQYSGWKVVAQSGDISPHTSSSLYFDRSRWPIKPDICMEGGNVLSDSAGMFEDRLDCLSLTSTGHQNNVALTSANATSAATAQAARLAALVMNRYPSYWPETVRGLLTHAAEWTDSMVQQLSTKHTKADRQSLLRKFGWGVPSENAVLNSGLGAVTLITQDEFVPFSGNQYSMRHFRLHPLPWPTDVLQNLGDAEVRLRITLSYFVEPSASRRGWRNKYQYPSHGLRFDLQGPLESQEMFIQRVNREARNEESGLPSNDSSRWFLGERFRHLGSLHQDEWVGTGAELAQCNNVAIYPVGGWWKRNMRKDRRDLPIRYSLVLSLQTEEQNIDLYTPIANQLPISVQTAVPVP